MSDIFALDEAGSRALALEAQNNLVGADGIHPGLWDGVPEAIGRAIPRAFADAARAGELAGSVAAGVAEPLFGYQQGELTDKYFGTVDPYIKNAVDYWTPSADSVGRAGQVLGGLTEGLVQLGIGGGNPSLMLASTGINRAMDLSDQGVQPDVAAAGGTIEASATAAGLRIPFLGKSLLTRMASGAAGNVAVGRAAQAAEQQLLEHTGNEKAAQGYSLWDLTGVELEALMGLAYGGIAHVASPVRPLEQDAALTTLNAKHFQQDTAPGVPADLAGAVVHQEAMEQAVRQTLAGNRVDVPPEATDASFLRRPESPERVTEPEQLALAFNRLTGASPDAASPVLDAEGIRAPANSLSEAVSDSGSGAAPLGTEPPGASSRPESQAAASSSDTPQLTGADHAVAAADFRVPTGETDAAGAPVTASARELLAQSRADVVRAQGESKAFFAATNCLLAMGIHNAG